MTRRDDDFDDDDYYPPERGRSAARGFRSSGMIIGLGVAVVVVVGSVVLFLTRSRQRAEQVAATLAETRTAPAPVARSFFGPVGNRSPNWMRVFGTWERELLGDNEMNLPDQLTFRSDLTMSVSRRGPDGNPQVQQGRVEVLVDEGTALDVKFPAADGEHVFHFRVTRNGLQLLLNEGKDEVAFIRPHQRTIPPPRPVGGTPPR